MSRQAWIAFVRSRTGNVAMLWAAMGAVLIGLVGISVDFTHAQAIRNQMQNAVDGACRGRRHSLVGDGPARCVAVV
jgi:Flp pilus assembly protein TadG